MAQNSARRSSTPGGDRGRRAQPQPEAFDLPLQVLQRADPGDRAFGVAFDLQVPVARRTVQHRPMGGGGVRVHEAEHRALLAHQYVVDHVAQSVDATLVGVVVEGQPVARAQERSGPLGLDQPGAQEIVLEKTGLS